MITIAKRFEKARWFSRTKWHWNLRSPYSLSWVGLSPNNKPECKTSHLHPHQYNQSWSLWSLLQYLPFDISFCVFSDFFWEFLMFVKVESSVEEYPGPSSVSSRAVGKFRIIEQKWKTWLFHFFNLRFAKRSTLLQNNDLLQKIG